jgi:K+-transporting ATPase KdpF subunit
MRNNLNADGRGWTRMDTDEYIKRSNFMKRQKKLNQLPITNSFVRHKLPLVIFLVLLLNVILAPVVYAVTDGSWQRTQAYALGILGLVILGLVIYLFDVVFRPERY